MDILNRLKSSLKQWRNILKSSWALKTDSIFGAPGTPVINIVTGEKIQCLCDHFIGRIGDLEYNPRIKKEKEKWLPLNRLNAPFNNKPLVFCYTHLLNDLNLLIEKLKLLEKPFLLVFHNSDYNFQKEYLRLFEELPKLEKIFTQNINVRDERVTPLPIGIANSMWDHGNLWTLTRAMRNKPEKKNLVYFQFNIRTNRSSREECFEKVQKKGIGFLPKKKHSEYLSLLASHKYAICPKGNGLDTHRFWECLYLNVVPICKRNTLVESFSADFPVVILDDWDDLDIDHLENKYHQWEWNYWHKLDMRYYEKLISL